MCRCYGTSSAPVRLRGVHAAASPGPERGRWCSDARDDPLGLHEHYTHGAIVVSQGLLGTVQHELLNAACAFAGPEGGRGEK